MGQLSAILLPWLFVAWWCYGKRIQKRAVVVLFAVTLVPVILCSDRGLWVGLLISVVYFAVRFAGQGKLALLGVFCGTLVVAAVVIVASPLGSLVSQRLAHGQSNRVRTSLTAIAVEDALSSPLIG